MQGEFWVVYGISAYATTCLDTPESRAENQQGAYGRCRSLSKPHPDTGSLPTVELHNKNSSNFQQIYLTP